jgi:hypothetical protein
MRSCGCTARSPGIVDPIVEAITDATRGPLRTGRLAWLRFSRKPAETQPFAIAPVQANPRRAHEAQVLSVRNPMAIRICDPTHT